MSNLDIYILAFAILILATIISQAWHKKHPDQDGEKDKIQALESRIQSLQIKLMLLTISFSVALLLVMLLIGNEMQLRADLINLLQENNQYMDRILEVLE